MKTKIVASLLLVTFLISAGVAQELAFPGAEGFGKFTNGGRGGQVLIVSNLNDSGPGSLRHAINTKGKRIITFSVSGTIALESDLPINDGDVTIAGQSAPGDGICIKNYPFRISADNVIIRYMRFRLGDEKKVEDDALKGNKANKVMIDHCSVSWSTDECASFYRNSNFTMQWCIISESLKNSVHQKGAHGYGGIWGGTGASFHHNLFAHHTSRNPRFSGSATTPNTEDELVDFTNNVIYNWGDNSTYGGEKGKYNMVNNYYKAGPATSDSKRDRIVNPSEPYGKFYVAGNFVAASQEVTTHNWNGGVQCESPEAAKAEKPFDVIRLSTIQSAEEAYQSVLKNAGASYCRDAVDVRIIKEVENGTATFGENGIIDSQTQVGGWPELKVKKAPNDSDQDGIPDKWEKKHNLNPEDSSDASQFSISKMYTNIELYLNELVD
ncbi:pectate lyase [Marivirga lumbricoides]|uniref:Pectate lyase n=1 Tax=Marivirga lumbricoides TaxID=1046115 RepID=A0ABQ1LD60_9BACT|nr:pectate lyase [Marivirga lumbricoides]